MASFEVRCIASAFAAAACIGFEWTVPAVVLLDIFDHIFLLVVPSETVLTEFFTIHNYQSRKSFIPYVHVPTLYPL